MIAKSVLMRPPRPASQGACLPRPTLATYATALQTNRESVSVLKMSFSSIFFGRLMEEAMAARASAENFPEGPTEKKTKN